MTSLHFCSRLYYRRWSFTQLIFLLVLETALVGVFYLLVTRVNDYEISNQPPYPKSLRHQNYDVNGMKLACDFPKLNPHSSTALWFFKKYSTITCKEEMQTITYYDGEAVRVNQSLRTLRMVAEKPTCWFRDVFYEQKSGYDTGEWKGPFDSIFPLKSHPEYIEVQCKDSQGEYVSKTLHYPVRKAQRAKGKPMETSFKKEKMNVLLIGVDSLSSQLYRRAMTKTREYMLETLGAVEMQMFHKVGNSTFSNLLAIMTGKSEIPDWSPKYRYDNLPFIWKFYESAGYRTQYISDHHDFNNFRSKPTDSFNLPMVKALLRNKSSLGNICFEDQVEIKLWLDLILEFAQDATFVAKNFFSLAMFRRPMHSNANRASGVDEHYLDFLKQLLESSLLDNTFLVLFGSNGPTAATIGGFSKTLEGSIEEKTTNMVIFVPRWFRKHYIYKEWYRNLLINAHRLTTNFDIYQTLISILHLSEKWVHSSQAHKGVSLFTEISPGRTCKQANISSRLCMCYFGAVPFENFGLQIITGKRVVQEINYNLFWYIHKCTPLRLQKVQSLAILEGNINSTVVFKILLTTVPGFGNFEATVSYSSGFWGYPSITILGRINRINAYRSQSECLENDNRLSIYCFCRDTMWEMTQ